MEHNEILKLIDYAKNQKNTNTLIERAYQGKGINQLELAQLYFNSGEDELLKIAEDIQKKKTNKVSLYTCLYITSKCINNCHYCDYKKNNSSMMRTTLTPKQVYEEAK